MRGQLKKFIEAMDDNSVAIIPAAHEQTRSYDTEYKFRQDSDFWYLTGFPEPYAIAVINKDGYIGNSTRSEIAYAVKQGKSVLWLEAPKSSQ